MTFYKVIFLYCKNKAKFDSLCDSNEHVNEKFIIVRDKISDQLIAFSKSIWVFSSIH